MNNPEIKKQMAEESPDKKGVLAWVEEHKMELLYAGVGLTAVVATLVGIKNKDSIIELWNSLKKQIEKGQMFSAKWFEKASLEELYKGRELVQNDYRNPELDIDYREACRRFLNVFDREIAAKKSGGKETGFPVHNSHGWYLPSDD